jgi:hypothetical protein
MNIAEAKQIAQSSLSKGRLRIAPRGLLPATAARLLLSVLHGKPKIYARRQLLYEARREQGLTCRGTPRLQHRQKARPSKLLQIESSRIPGLSGLSARDYMREYMRLRRGSRRRNKIKPSVTSVSSCQSSVALAKEDHARNKIKL